MTKKTKEVRSKGKGREVAKGTAEGPTDEMLAAAFKRGQDEKVAWYEKHIHEQFVLGPGGTRWLGQQIPEHVRNMYGSLSEAIKHYVEDLQDKAFERRLPSVPSEPPKEQGFKVGDWVVCDKRHRKPSDGRSGWDTAMDQYVGKPMQVEFAYSDTRMATTHSCWSWDFEWLRLATPAEIEAHQRASEPVESWKVKVDGYVRHYASKRIGKVITFATNTTQVLIRTPPAIGTEEWWHVTQCEEPTTAEVEAYKSLALAAERKSSEALRGDCSDDATAVTSRNAQSTGEKVEVEDPKLTFGTRVECRDRKYRILSMEPDRLGFVPLWSEDFRTLFHAKPSEFTIIEQ